MKTQTLLLMFFLLLFASACAGPPVSTRAPQPAVSPTVVQETAVPAPQTTSPNTPAQPSHVLETAAPDCLGDEISPLGKVIAEDYEGSSYEQVMTWFCNGAEFEDILLALETEAQTDTPADEILEMLADGFSWEEIWLLAGLIE